MKKLIKAVILLNANPVEREWIENNLIEFTSAADFNSAYAFIARKTRKTPLKPAPEVFNEIELAFPGLNISDFTLDRLCRVYCLMLIAPADKTLYFQLIEHIFLTADINEQVGVYSALPLLAWPELWEKRCAEGIRSNMAPVLEAIMYNNPYPFQNLDETAWNQLVLKAFFTEKIIRQITGLFARNHRDLALMLIGYARERRAAGRTVDPVLWRLAGPYASAQLMPDFERVMTEDSLPAKEQLAEGVFFSNFKPALLLITGAGFTLPFPIL